MRLRHGITVWGPMVALVALAACSEDPGRAAVRHTREADAYAGQGKYKEAIIEYRSALQIDPKLGNVRLKLADAYVQTSDLTNALREYVRAADLLPDSDDAQRKAGTVLLLTGQFEEAKQRAQRVLARQPSNGDALILLANSMAGLRDLPNAIGMIEKAIERVPSSSDVYLDLGILQYASGNLEQSEQAFQRAVEAAPTSVNARLALGHFYWASRRLDDAERAFQEAFGLEPGNVIANRALALYYVAKSEPARAERYLRNVTASAPDDAGARIVLADYYLVSGREGEARAILEGIRREARGSGPAQMRLAALAFAGSHAVGHRLIDELLVTEPNNAAAMLIKGRFMMADRRTDEALPVVQKATTLDPLLVPALGTLGDIYLELKQWDQAVLAYNDVLRLAPRSAQAQRRLAQVHLSRGDDQTAVSFARQAIRTDPTNPLGYLVLAQGLIAHGDLREAEVALTRVSTLTDASSPILVQVGRLRLSQGSYAAARRAFLRALELDRSAVDAVDGLVSVSLAEKNPGEARRVADAQVAKRPKDAQLQVVAARAYDTVGDAVATERALRAAIGIDPAQMDAYLHLAKFYARTHRLDEAHSEFTKLLAAQPKSIAAGTMLGMVLQLQGKPADARERYARTVEVDSRAAIAANNLSWLYADSDGNLDVALQLAQGAKAQLPDRHEITDTLGWVYYKKGLGSLAVTTFKQTVAAQPSNPVYLYHLGLAYVQTGDKKGARQSIERALKIAPAFDGADDARRVLQSLAADVGTASDGRGTASGTRATNAVAVGASR